MRLLSRPGVWSLSPRGPWHELGFVFASHSSCLPSHLFRSRAPTSLVLLMGPSPLDPRRSRAWLCAWITRGLTKLEPKDPRLAARLSPRLYS